MDNNTVIGDISHSTGNTRVDFGWYKRMEPQQRATVFVFTKFREEVFKECPDRKIEVSELEYWKLKNDLADAERRAGY